MTRCRSMRTFNLTRDNLPSADELTLITIFTNR